MAPLPPNNEFAMAIPTTDYGAEASTNPPEPAGLSGGSNHSRGLRRNRAPGGSNAGSRSNSPSARSNQKTGARAMVRGVLPRRAKSNDSNDSSATGSTDKSPRRLLSGLRGKKPPPQQAMEASVTATDPAPLRRTENSPPMMNGKGMRRTARATAPGAVSESVSQDRHEQQQQEPSLMRGASDAQMRGRDRATAPGAVSEALSSDSVLSSSVAAAASSLPRPSYKSTGTDASTASFTTSYGDGKVRRARATAPGAVQESSAAEPSLGASVHGAASLKRTGTDDSSVSASMAARSPVRKVVLGSTSPNWGAAAAPAPLSSFSSNGNASANANASTQSEEDREAQAARRKEIQKVMWDRSLTQKEKQAKMQEIMSRGGPPGQTQMQAQGAPEPASRNSSNLSAVAAVTATTTTDATSSVADHNQNNNSVAATEDPQVIRRKLIQDLMRDPNLTQKEKQAKMQEIMTGGMSEVAPKPTVATTSTDPPAAAAASSSSADTSTPLITDSLGVVAADAAANEEHQNDAEATAATETEDPQAVRRKQIQEIMKDPSLSQREKQIQMQQLMAGGMPKVAPKTESTTGTPVAAAELGEGTAAIQTEDTRSVATRMEDVQMVRRKQLQAIMRDPNLSQREKQVQMQTLNSRGMPKAQTAPSQPEDELVSQTATAGAVRRPAPGSDLGDILLDKTEPREAALENSQSSMADSSSNANCRVSRRERIRDVNSKPPVEPSTGVGGAPQGKMRRTGTVDASRPGAMSVAPSEPSVASMDGGSQASTGVGGAPQGKMRRAVTTPAAPGAVSVAPPEPGSMNRASSGVGGAPERKIARSATDTLPGPGAVSVVEPNTPSERGNDAPTGVGGAPQGKFKRTTSNAPAQPGAVSVVEPNAASEPAGGLRRTTSKASAGGSSTGVGGAPEGKMRRTATTSARPGAVSVVEPSSSGLGTGSSHSTVAQPGMAVSSHGIRHAAMSEPSSRSGVGGAPQGKLRRVTTTPAALPGAVSVVEPNLNNSSTHTTGVGGAPQGKLRRTTIATNACAGNGIQNPSASPAEPTFRKMVGSSNEPNAIVSAVSLRAVQTEGDGDGVVSSIERDMMAKYGARRSRASVTGPIQPGAQSVAVSEPGNDAANEASQAERDLMSKTRARSSAGRPLEQAIADQDVDAAAQSVERDLLAKRQNRRGRATAPGIQSVTEPTTTREPTRPSGRDEGDFNDAVQAVENDIQTKFQIRRSRGMGSVVPGATHSQYENDEATLRKDPRVTSSRSIPNPTENPAENDEKAVYRTGAPMGSTQPLPTVNRMEQKILQFEQEQQARDNKLEEIEEMNLRRLGPERTKLLSSPTPQGDEPEDGVENGFLNPDPEAIRRAEEDGLAIAMAIQEDEEDDIYEVELKMYDPDAKPPFHQNRRFRCYSCVICLVIVAAIIVAAFFATKKSSTTVYITQPPTAAPSQAPTTTRDTAVRGELARVIGDFVNEPGTIYDQALRWILFKDPMMLDEFSENLVQRYILALFYLQTSQEGPWRSCSPPAEGENSTCVYEELKTRDDDAFTHYWEPKKEREFRWLSDRHECEWSDIQCHPATEGNVIAIDILGQNLTGTLPEELKYLDHLMWLSLSFNFFTGTIPAAYGELPYLTIFECTNNMITGQIPSGFFHQTNLLQLNPAMNMISGTIPSEIGLLTSLNSLFFFTTFVGGSLPSEIGNMQDVRNIWWQNNTFTGAIPSEIGQLSLLETLYLNQNELSGSIPTGIGQATSLIDIQFQENALEGPLPSELGLLKNILQFQVSSNKLSGTTIPEEIWDWTQMIYLDLGKTNLEGTLSTRIGQLTHMQAFVCSYDQLTGTIPTEVGLLTDLIMLHVHNNLFRGNISLDICRGCGNLSSLNADCGGNPPEVTCPAGCCTGCCNNIGQCQLV